MKDIYTETLGKDNVLAICKEFELKEEDTEKVSMALSMYDRFYNHSKEDSLTDEDITDIILTRLGDDEDGRIICACMEIIAESYVLSEMSDDDIEVTVH